MGIKGLWDVLGKGEEYAIEDYAAAHWDKHKRPLRIAVDEACWRFNNLSEGLVARIREGEPAANPIEKTIFWRILRLWKLNIQLVFITDGLRKPGKKRNAKKNGGGRGGGKVDAECIKMLHKLFDRMHVPYHQAPGEAEAECARLQQLNVVDAVWSDDCDVFMFGCTTLIKAHKTASGKDWKRIQVYNAETILPRFDFDTDSLVMFAVLAGGDYDDKGLPGCGVQKTKRLVQRKIGLAQSLTRCANKDDLAVWRGQLRTILREMDYTLEIPPQFPVLKALNGYSHPAISTDDQCRNLRGLHQSKGGWEWWENQMDQTKLRVVLREHYNISTRQYLDHLAPVFLARALTRNVTPERRHENLSHGVALRRTMNRKGKDGEDIGQPSEINIKFNARLLVRNELFVQPPEEDWSSTVKGDGVPYDPTKPIDGTMLSCFLNYGLPEGALDKPSPSPKKKRSKKSTVGEVVDDIAVESSEVAHVVASQVSKSRKLNKSSQPDDLDANRKKLKISQSKATGKRKISPKDATSADRPPKKSRKTAERVPSLSPAPQPKFRRLEIPNLSNTKPNNSAASPIPASSLVIDLDDDSDSGLELVVSSAPARTPESSPMHTRPTASATSHLKIHSGTHAKRSERTMSDSHKSKEEPTLRSYASRASTYSDLAVVQASAAQDNARSSLPPSSMGHPVLPFKQSMRPTSATEESDPAMPSSAALLRQRREAGLLSRLTKQMDNVPTNEPPATTPATTPAPAPPAQPEIIDLT